MSTGRPAGNGHAVYRARSVSRKGLWIRLAVLTTILMLLGAGLVFALRSDTFTVVEVQPGETRFTDAKELERLLGAFQGRNLWTLQSGEVADSLAVLPWIKELQVKKELPGYLGVEFQERRPVLSLEQTGPGGKMQVLVDDGRILPFPEHLPAPALPALVGVPCAVDTLDGLRKLDPEWSPLVADLLTAVAVTGLESSVPIDFIVARPEGFAIVLQKGQGRLLVGKEDFSGRLARFMAARDHLEPGLQMDLRFRDKITCSRI